MDVWRLSTLAKAISYLCQEQRHVHSHPMASWLGSSLLCILPFILHPPLGVASSGVRQQMPSLPGNPGGIAKTIKLPSGWNVIQKSRPMIYGTDIGSVLFLNASFSQRVLPHLIWVWWKTTCPNSDSYLLKMGVGGCRREWQCKHDSDDILRGSNKADCVGNKPTNITGYIKSWN